MNAHLSSPQTLWQGAWGSMCLQCPWLVSPSPIATFLANDTDFQSGEDTWRPQVRMVGMEVEESGVVT